jgi:hypothetical protein
VKGLPGFARLPTEMIPAADLDQLLLSFCDRRWLKVARIAGKTLDAIEARGIKPDGTFADQIDAHGRAGRKRAWKPRATSNAGASARCGCRVSASRRRSEGRA